MYVWGPIYKISYDLSEDYLKFIVGSTYNSELQHAKLFPRNIASYFTNTASDDHTILQVNRTWEKLSILCVMFCKLDIRRKSVITLTLS